MKSRTSWITAVALATCFVSTNAMAQTGDAKSSQSPEYELARQRGTQAVIWGLPAVSMKFFFEGMQAVGAGYQDVVYFSQPMVSRHAFLTANNNVPYVAVFLNTKAGPMVLDVPAASEKTMYFGSILDMWQTPIADVGPAGADKGKGGKFLFLPPGYEGTVPDGYLVFRPDTYTLPVALRPVSRNGGTLEEAVAFAKTLRAYSLKDAANPPGGKYIDVWPTSFNPLVDFGTYFEHLAEVINEEPVLERDLAMMGMLWSIGIRKGQPFKPEGDTTQALKQAATIGYDILQARLITPGGAFQPHGSGTQWLLTKLDKANAGPDKPIAWYARTPYDDDIPAHRRRVMNGFAKITLTRGGGLKEQFINQKGAVEWQAERQ